MTYICAAGDHLKLVTSLNLVVSFVWCMLIGKLFFLRAHKANLIHPDLPVISRCHNYKIQTKYTYKCVSCGYQLVYSISFLFHIGSMLFVVHWTYVQPLRISLHVRSNGHWQGTFSQKILNNFSSHLIDWCYFLNWIAQMVNFCQNSFLLKNDKWHS
jgi:hypothetical protein